MSNPRTLPIFRGRRRSRPTARAASPSPICRIAARCCACRTRSGPGQVTRPAEIDEYSLASVFAAANAIDTLIVGTGTEVWVPPRAPARGAARGARGARPDADRPCDPHLQHHAGRAAPRRGGADRGAMSGGGRAEGRSRPSAPTWCGPMISCATPRPCSCRGRNAGRCSRSMPSTSRSLAGA